MKAIIKKGHNTFQSKALLTKNIRFEIYQYFSINEAFLKLSKLSKEEREQLKCLINVDKKGIF